MPGPNSTPTADTTAPGRRPGPDRTKQMPPRAVQSRGGAPLCHSGHVQSVVEHSGVPRQRRHVGDRRSSRCAAPRRLTLEMRGGQARRYVPGQFDQCGRQLLADRFKLGKESEARSRAGPRPPSAWSPTAGAARARTVSLLTRRVAHAEDVPSRIGQTVHETTCGHFLLVDVRRAEPDQPLDRAGPVRRSASPGVTGSSRPVPRHFCSRWPGRRATSGAGRSRRSPAPTRRQRGRPELGEAPSAPRSRW